ncbi:MAG: hypothetical protein IPN52_05985 [Micrococcales bacterium]|nr:hypothetical protein [Micrococcales bacterium]
MLERQADQQLAELVQVGRFVELGADRQLALALLTLPGLPFIAARHDSHLARLRVEAREEGILCLLARVHHVDHEPNEVLIAIRDR